MSFEAYWSQLGTGKQRGDDSTRMRLNQTEDGGYRPGRLNSLNVTESVLRTRAGKAETVRRQFLQADHEVMRETGQVSSTLQGFATQRALTTFQDRWRDQMSYTKSLFTKTASALRDAADNFEKEDATRARSFGGG